MDVPWPLTWWINHLDWVVQRSGKSKIGQPKGENSVTEECG